REGRRRLLLAAPAAAAVRVQGARGEEDREPRGHPRRRGRPRDPRVDHPGCRRPLRQGPARARVGEGRHRRLRRRGRPHRPVPRGLLPPRPRRPGAHRDGPRARRLRSVVPHRGRGAAGRAPVRQGAEEPRHRPQAVVRQVLLRRPRAALRGCRRPAERLVIVVSAVTSAVEVPLKVPFPKVSFCRSQACSAVSAVELPYEAHTRTRAHMKRLFYPTSTALTALGPSNRPVTCKNASAITGETNGTPTALVTALPRSRP